MYDLFISALANFVIGTFAFSAGALWTWRKWIHELRRDRERIEEGITAELIRQRVTHSVALMQALEPMSSLHMACRSEEERRSAAAEAAAVIHRAIFGPVGVLATHETREVLVCARARCRFYADGSCSYDKMFSTIWAVHQMLRADLSLRQPGLATAIDGLRRSDQPETNIDIDILIDTLKHIEWKPDGELKA